MRLNKQCWSAFGLKMPNGICYTMFLYNWLKSHPVCNECWPWSHTLIGRCLGRSFCALSEPEAWGTNRVSYQTEQFGRKLTACSGTWRADDLEWENDHYSPQQGSWDKEVTLPLIGHHKIDINPIYIATLHANVMSDAFQFWSKVYVYTDYM